MATKSAPKTNSKSAGAPVPTPVEDAAEAFVELLNNNGVDYIFINSGTDTFPIQEAMARMIDQERRVPGVVLCLDELTAMTAAHGYFQVTGKPQVVLVHVDAGTLQIGGAYHDAQRDRAGVVVCAGRAPVTIGGGVVGGKDMAIHWTQEQLDQGGIVRNFTKWEYELRRVESMHLVLHKAFQVASAEPAGPVYLTLPRELLMEPMSEVLLPPKDRHARPVTPAADSAALAEIAGWLTEAEKPVIVAHSYGRNPEAVPTLVALAESVGARVIIDRHRMSFPTTHPLCVMGDTSVLTDADAVLVLDADVPWIPGTDGPGPSARIAWIDQDPAKSTIPLWSFAVDLLVHASTDKAVAALLEQVKSRLTRAVNERVQARTKAIAGETKTAREGRHEAARAKSTDSPIAAEWLAYCLNEVLPTEAIVLNEAVSHGVLTMNMVDRTIPGSLYDSGGSSLGWSLGAAIGMKLARPDKDIVALVGDGTFVYGTPTSALWAAEQCETPFMTVIFNNSMHWATKRALLRSYSDSVSARTNRFVGVDIEPSPDFDVLATASRAYGERVDDPAEVVSALKRGLERIRAGQAAVIDVRVARY